MFPRLLRPLVARSLPTRRLCYQLIIRRRGRRRRENKIRVHECRSGLHKRCLCLHSALRRTGASEHSKAVPFFSCSTLSFVMTPFSTSAL